MLRVVQPKIGVPVHIQLEVTWRCNWRCVHCYQDDHKTEALPGDRLIRLIDELADAGTMHLIVTGGEPTTRRDLPEILAAARNRGMACTLYTNGHLVDEASAARLSRLIAMAEISLLAGEEAVHDGLAGVKGAFRRATRAIRLFREHGVAVMVKTPLLRPAVPTLKALERTVAELDAEWHVDPEITRTYAGSLRPLDNQLSFEEAVRFYEEFPRFHPQSGYTADPGVQRGMCLAARQYCFIDAFGNVYPCLSFKSACDAQEKRGETPAAKMGNILEQPFAAIWKSGFAQRVRQVSRDDFTTCSHCEGQSFCNPCMASNYEAHQNLFRPSPVVCEKTKVSLAWQKPGFVPASEIGWNSR